ncbi:MAG: hydantoinase/oxoprolinase family protein [Betaproteobacteria bacterium]|nr:hydantoinase/oxoprolinase family protein [Betaproteobacteria bacterium]
MARHLERPYALGIDIGGTFTDVVVIEADGTVHVGKGISRPDAFERGIFAILDPMLEGLGLMSADCSAIVHGTTVATNAIIERKGAVTGLITTSGFRDVLELRRIRIPRLYDLEWQKPEPLVPRYLREEVIERMTHDGRVQTPLDAGSVKQATANLRARGVSSIAVCLLNSYVNSAHEEAVREIVRKEAPELYATVSSDLLREMREYERTSTVVINAYITPVVRRYVASLSEGLVSRGYRTPLMIMQSSGGAMSAEIACDRPIHVIESGPAAGTVAAQHLARSIGERNAVALDIGGTTAKAALIENGAISYSSEYEIGGDFSRSGRMAKGGGYVLRAPTLDISEIGAGGGSIVWLDSGGALHVGPQSAGATPGPACYGLGGSDPTLTDACLLLGYLGAPGLADGAIPLDTNRARTALARIAQRLDMDLVDFSHGVYRIAVSNMTRAIRSVSTERGKDPRDYSLVAFGGNGGLFAAAIARELELRRVIIPPAAGIFSAFGALYAEVEHHLTQTVLGLTDAIDVSALEASWGLLERQALATLEREAYSRNRCILERMGELRYHGQLQELSIPWPAGATTRDSLARLSAAFEDAHERTYGHRAHDSMVELVNLRLVARGVQERLRVPERLRFARGRAVPIGERRAYFGSEHGWVNVSICDRSGVGANQRHGPLVIQEFDSTILVPPDFSVRVDDQSNAILLSS